MNPSAVFPPIVWLGGFLILLVHTDPICVEGAVTACSSNVVTPWEATLSLLLSALTIAIGLFVGGSVSSQTDVT